MRFHGLSSNFKLHLNMYLKMKAVDVYVLLVVMYLSICRKLSFRAAILQLLLGFVQILSAIYYGRCPLTLKQRHSCHRERTCRHCVWTSIYSYVGTIFSKPRQLVNYSKTVAKALRIGTKVNLIIYLVRI